MAVVVRLTNGTMMTYPDGDAAGSQGPLFVVSKLNHNTRERQTLEVFGVQDVVFAEVSESGIVRRVIAGRVPRRQLD